MARHSKDTYLEQLGKVPLFETCTKKELKELAQLCDHVDAAAGTVICQQGSVGYECFVIISGQAAVDVDGTILATLKDGGYFGELALLDKRPRSATVTAISDCHMLVLGPRQFSSAIDSIPGLAHRIMSGLAGRLRAADAMIASR